MITKMSLHSNVSHFSIRVNPEELLVGIKKLIQVVRCEWNVNYIKFKVFTEGYSNQLVGCFPENDEPAILFRVYGAGTELFIDRQAEIKNMGIVASHKLGPELIATFENGLIYYFVPGNTLNVDNVSSPTIWPLIAQQLGKMHRIPVVSSSPLWEKMRTLINALPDDMLTREKFIRFKETLPDKNKLCDEVSWAQQKLENTKSPIVFCHNDLLLGNILVNDSNDSATFIDYEYGFPNYQAYDIANHFNEYAGVVPVDFSRIPNLEHQRRWIKEYLTVFHNGEEVSVSLLDNTCKEVQIFMPVSHLFWGIWALVQAIYSPLDVGFSEYGSMKIKAYFQSKRFIENCS